MFLVRFLASEFEAKLANTVSPVIVALGFLVPIAMLFPKYRAALARLSHRVVEAS